MQAVGSRYNVEPDSISYLNLSDLYATGQWSLAVNGYWSPGYPLLIGLLRRIAKPSLYWESSAVHALNFVLCLAAFAAFRFFLRELSRVQLDRQSRLLSDFRSITFEKPLEIACAISLFLWGALKLTTTGTLTPDMMLAAVVFCIAGVLLKLRAGAPSMKRFVLLGGLLGVGYLTKAVMFPMGCLIALTCAAGLKGSRTWLVGTMICLAAFLFVASPQIVAMSRLAGHLSYGQVGAIAYAWKVNGVTRWWIGQPPGSGVPTHPVRRISRSPDAYAFASPRPSSSYPFWDQPAYWLDGIRPRFSLRQQVSGVAKVFKLYARLMGPLALAFVTLFFVGGRRKVLRLPYLLLPGTAVFALYSLVHAELRFFGAWAVIVFLTAISGLEFAETRRRIVYTVLGLVAVLHLTPIATESAFRARQLAGIFTGYSFRHTQWTVAANLQRLGVPPGSPVGSIGRALDGYWARLAGVQIAMEINNRDAPLYWSAPDSVKNSVMRNFARLGARAIIANHVPEDMPGAAWVSLGGGYFARTLDDLQKDSAALGRAP